MPEAKYMIIGYAPEGSSRQILVAESEQEARDAYLAANPGKTIVKVLGPEAP